MKKVLVIFLILISFAAGAIASDMLNIDLFRNNQGDVSADAMVVDVTEISELASIQYDYKDDFEYDGESLEFLDKTIPFTNKSMTVYYEGTVKIGADMEKAKLSLNVKENKAALLVPHCEILSHEIDEDSFVVKDVNNGLFNRVNLEDDTKFRQEQKKAVEYEIKADGYIREADEKLEAQLTKYFKRTYPKLKVDITFK